MENLHLSNKKEIDIIKIYEKIENGKPLNEEEKNNLIIKYALENTINGVLRQPTLNRDRFEKYLYYLLQDANLENSRRKISPKNIETFKLYGYKIKEKDFKTVIEKILKRKEIKGKKICITVSSILKGTFEETQEMINLYYVKTLSLFFKTYFPNDEEYTKEIVDFLISKIKIKQ